MIAMKLWKSIKSISSLIAVIILIAITVAGGLLVFALMTSTLTNSNQRTQVSFESLSLYRSTGEPEVLFAATIKNTGNRPIKQLTVKVHDEPDYPVPSVNASMPLETGRTVGVTLTPPKIHSERYVVGNAYSVTVKAEAVDGSTFSTVASVKCLGVGGPSVGQKTITCYSTAKDGYVERAVVDDTEWDWAHNNVTGSWAEDVNTPIYTEAFFDGVSYRIMRSFLCFDTSEIPDNALIKSVTLGLSPTNVMENANVSAQRGTQADVLTLDDYDSFEGNEYGHSTSWIPDQYNAINFNALGISEINETGITKICIREYDHDFFDVAPQSNVEFGITYCGNEDGEGYQPKLVITYTLPVTPQTEEMFEHYNVGDDTDALFYANTWLSQTFTPSKKHTITSLRLKLFREGLPHDLTVSIQATSEGVPNGEDLCVAEIDGDTLTEDAEGEWYKITFENRVVLDVVQYAVVCRALEGVEFNAVLWRENQTESSYIGGSKVYSDDSGDTWEIMEPEDFMFEEWGYELIVPTEEKFESQEEIDDEAEIRSVWWFGQTFTPQITHKLTKVILKLYCLGEPEGDFIVSIRETEEGLPIGDDLVSKSMLAMDITDNPEGAFYEFVFNTQITLEADTKYAIVMKCPEGDDLNLINVFLFASYDTYPRGQMVETVDGVNWGFEEVADLYFSERGY